VYVPKDPQLHHNIVHTHHDSVMTGHPGQWKTLELVSHNYWWPGISCYVASYVAGCNACNQCKQYNKELGALAICYPLCLLRSGTEE
jgi:Integrase zinc binding domain